MGKFHIAKDGKIKECTAARNCPLGGLHVEANSPKEAQELINKELAKKYHILPSQQNQILEKEYEENLTKSTDSQDNKRNSFADIFYDEDDVRRWIAVQPDKKDIERAKNIPSQAKAEQQANSIKDFDKLLRRYKAVRELDMNFSKANIYGNAVPFRKNLQELGLSDEHINRIDMSIVEKRAENNGITNFKTNAKDGIFKGDWSSGDIGKYHFEIKHFDEPSDYGVNEGRISKLSISNGRKTLVNYDRGWDIEPPLEAKETFDKILQLFN